MAQLNDYMMTIYTKIGDQEHILGPFRRRSRSAGAAISGEMRDGQWDANVVQVRAELVSTLGQDAFLKENARG